MRRRRIALGAVGVVTFTALVGFSAQTAIAASGVVKAKRFCGLLPSAKVASVHVADKCTQGATYPFNYLGVHVGSLTSVRWGQGHLANGAINASVYKVNPAYLSRAKATFTKHGGTKINVGSWGLLTHVDKGAAGITFGVGDYIVQLAVNTPGTKQFSSSNEMKQRATALAASMAKGL